MLRKITRSEIITLIKNFDKRTETFTDEDYNYVMDMGYAELATIVHAFTNEEVVSLKPFYEAGENKFTIDVEEDVAYVYDLYLTIENLTNLDLYKHGIKKLTDENIVYKDSRMVGRVHVDLTNMDKETYPEIVEGTPANNLVIKYAYTPTSTTEDIYIDQPTYLAMRDAFGAALYNRLNDVERESQKRASLQRTGLAIVPQLPNDFRIIGDSDIADEGLIVARSVFKGFGV